MPQDPSEAPPLPPTRGGSPADVAVRRAAEAKAEVQRLQTEIERLQNKLQEAQVTAEREAREAQLAIEREEAEKRRREEEERLRKEEEERLRKEEEERLRQEEEKRKLEEEERKRQEEERRRIEEENRRIEEENRRLAEAERKKKEAAEAEERKRLLLEEEEKRKQLESQQTFEGEDEEMSQFMAECPSCSEPNIFPEGCSRIACWNCNNAMNAPPGMFQQAVAPVTQVPEAGHTPDPTPQPAPPQSHQAPVEEEEEDIDLEGLAEAVCKACNETNFLPEGAPKVACWNCSAVVEAPVASVATTPALTTSNAEPEEEDEDQVDCPSCGEPNIFPEFAPRIACWCCTKPIDRPKK